MRSFTQFMKAVIAFLLFYIGAPIVWLGCYILKDDDIELIINKNWFKSKKLS